MFKILIKNNKTFVIKYCIFWDIHIPFNCSFKFNDFQFNEYTDSMLKQIKNALQI